jgi:hypothetical protein
MHVAPEWIEAHCVIPDGFRKGQPFALYDYQLAYVRAFYTVRGTAPWVPQNPVLAPAFIYRRGLLVGPQKVGKNPLVAAQVCLEAVGPALFAGWAEASERYVCAEHGCRCGWEYAYDPGEPKGMPWPTPLVQITAFSQDSTENTYDALRPMIELGPLTDLIPRTGEEFIRLPGGGRIDTVTASDQSRLGQRVTFVPQDELGLWTATNRMIKVADTQYRNLAGMGGRASLTTNAWDPAEHSVAQREYESSASDICRQFVEPPRSLSYGNKAERRRIHRIVYPPDTLRENGGHIDLDSIEAEAADLVAKDPPQAERFYGNRRVSGGGRAFDAEAWAKLADSQHEVPSGALIVLGFDGSRTGDWSALIATEISCGHQWPIGIWNPADHPRHEIPGAEVDTAVDTAFAAYRIVRFYVDPPYWKDELATWQGRYGEQVVMKWETYRPRPIGAAVRNFATAIATGTLRHDGDPTFAAHVGNAYRRPLLVRDDKGDPLWTLSKETPASGLKIDAAMAGVLSWEARTDAIAAGALTVQGPSIYESGESILL